MKEYFDFAGRGTGYRQETLAFIGLNETGLMRLGVPWAPVMPGDLKQSTALLALFAFLAIVLM